MCQTVQTYHPPASQQLLLPVAPEMRVIEELAGTLRPPHLSPIWVHLRDNVTQSWRAFNWPWSVIDSNLLPLEFAKKTLAFSSLIPGVGSTYTFGSDEDAYHEQYSRSVFAITMKKAGWDWYVPRAVAVCVCFVVVSRSRYPYYIAQYEALRDFS
jgi:hypothetical protein